MHAPIDPLRASMGLRCGKELPDRWEQVSALVPGKSKAQCFKRFKEMREAFRAKKGSEPRGVGGKGTSGTVADDEDM